MNLFSKVLCLAAVASSLACARAVEPSPRLFLWVELIGFDNSKPDYGVGEYLGRMKMKPEVISLLLNDDNLALKHHAGSTNDFPLPLLCCSYNARPFNPERRRQNWTANQLKGLVAELKRHGVSPFASFFSRHGKYPAEQAVAETAGTQLAAFLSDFGFAGLHGSDGYAPPRYVLPECQGKERVRIAREYARRYADNWRTIVSKLKPLGLKCWINTCWTRDPYEALYRYGVDYRLLAKTGVDGFVVESSAAAQSIENWNFQASAPIDRSMAMLMRLRACVPDLPFVLLHAINDGTEQWSALRHAPTRTASEAYMLGSVFFGRRRALDGFLACLADGITADEWNTLNRIWRIAFTPAKDPLGLRVVWSDRAFDREFEECVVSGDASSNTLVAELIHNGALLNASVSVADAIADKSLPILVANPEFFPPEELAALRDRRAPVVEIGRGAHYSTSAAFLPEQAAYVPVAPGTPPFPGFPKETSCYWKKPLPENLPPACVFAHVRGGTWNEDAVPFVPTTPGVRVAAYRMENGRLAIFARNENDTYLTTSFRFHSKYDAISDVKVHTDFPSQPFATTLSGRIAPYDTIFFSVGEHVVPMSNEIP